MISAGSVYPDRKMGLPPEKQHQSPRLSSVPSRSSAPVDPNGPHRIQPPYFAASSSSSPAALPPLLYSDSPGSQRRDVVFLSLGPCVPPPSFQRILSQYHHSIVATWTSLRLLVYNCSELYIVLVSVQYNQLPSPK